MLIHFQVCVQLTFSPQYAQAYVPYVVFGFAVNNQKPTSPQTIVGWCYLLRRA